MVKKTAVNIARKYISYLPKEMAVKKAYLFGSYAKGNYRDDSDIDVAVIIDNAGDIFDIQMQLLRLRRKVDLRIEPHPIKEQDFSSLNPIADEIMQSGILLLMSRKEKLSARFLSLPTDFRYNEMVKLLDL